MARKKNHFLNILLIFLKFNRPCLESKFPIRWPIEKMSFAWSISETGMVIHKNFQSCRATFFCSDNNELGISLFRNLRAMILLPSPVWSNFVKIEQGFFRKIINLRLLYMKNIISLKFLPLNHLFRGMIYLVVSIRSSGPYLRLDCSRIPSSRYLEYFA